MNLDWQAEPVVTSTSLILGSAGDVGIPKIMMTKKSKNVTFTVLSDATCDILELPNGFTTGGNKYGQIVVYHCNDGFTLEGDKMSTCRSDKRWSRLMPTCKRKLQKAMRVLQ